MSLEKRMVQAAYMGQTTVLKEAIGKQAMDATQNKKGGRL